MGISRRSVLSVGCGAIVSATTLNLRKSALAAPALLGLKDLPSRTLSFDCYHTGESLKRVTYWAEGKYDAEALAEINYALRDYRSGDVHPIDPKALDLLHRVGRELDTNCNFEMYSGYRSPKTNAMLRQFDSEVAEHSLHMKGQAVDITLPGRSLRDLHKVALALQVGGVGYYPDANFVHVDVGRVRSWVGLG